MGVRGLSSYVTVYQRSCAEHVELGSGNGDQDDGAISRLAVDGSALVYHIMRNAREHRLHLELGCDYLALGKALLSYLSALTKAGIIPVVIMDGMQDHEKEATTLARRRAQVEEASQLMEDTGANGVGARTSSPAANRLTLLPMFAAEALIAACRAARVAFRVADREADPELAAACYPRSPTMTTASGSDPEPAERTYVDAKERDGVCDAVLSNDSDFLIMDIPGYIPFWALGLGEDGSAGALVFRRSKLAARLNVPEACLPDLACLIGNDWIQPDESVHRVIMNATTSNAPTRDTVNARSVEKKRRRGTRGGTSNSMNSSPPAKDLVEATGRFLARFFDQRQSSNSDQPIDSNSRHMYKPGAVHSLGYRRQTLEPEEDSSQGIDGACHGPTVPCRRHRDRDEQANSSRRKDDDSRSVVGGDVALCAMFYTDMEDKQGAPRSISDERKKLSEVRTCQSPGNGHGDGTTSTSVTAGPDHDHRFDGNAVFATTASSFTLESLSLKGTDRSGRRTKGKGKKTKKGKSRKLTSSESKARGEAGRDAGDTVLNGVNGEGGDEGNSGGGGEFLRRFRAAKLHFQVPPDYQEQSRGDEPPCNSGASQPAGSSPARAPTRPAAGASSLASGAGISIPPELTQAVVEGVFWCRVLLEDDPTSRREVDLPTDQLPQSPTSTDSVVPSLLARSSLDRQACDSSAFGSFSHVRRRLYELCFALRTVTATGPAFKSAGSFVNSAGASEVAQDFCQANVEVGCKGLQEGRQWVVKEYRRVGSSVKPVHVLCQVPSEVHMSSAPATRPVDDSHVLNSDDSRIPNGLSMERWALLLSVLGLEQHDNRLLTALFITESCEHSAAEDHAQDWDERPKASSGLGAVALVAAILLSTALGTAETALARTELNDERTGAARLDCCSYEIALAFAVAATQSSEVALDSVLTKSHGRSNRVVVDQSDQATMAEARPLQSSEVLDVFQMDVELSRRRHGRATDGCGCECDRHGDDEENAQGIYYGTVTASASTIGIIAHQGRNQADVRPGRAPQDPRQVKRDIESDKTKRKEDGIGSRSRRRVEFNRPTNGGATGGLCDACLQKGNGRAVLKDDGNEAMGDVDRRFVGLWSHVQSAVWHINACQSVLEQSQPGGSGGQRGGVLALDPFRLRPALALDVYRRSHRFRRLHAQQRSRSSSDPYQQAQQHISSNSYSERLRRPPISLDSSGIAPQTSGLSSQHRGQRSKDIVHVGLVSCGVCSSGTGEPHGHDRRGEGTLKTHVSSTRRVSATSAGEALEGSDGCTEDLGAVYAVSERCTGSCAWSRRVRTVMDAAQRCRQSSS